MSCADDLVTVWYCSECGGTDALLQGFMHISGYENPCATQPVQVPLALPSDDPRPMLDAMGLDAIDGWLSENHETWWVNERMVEDEHYVPALVVRPRGENDVTTPWVARERPVPRGEAS